MKDWKALLKRMKLEYLKETAPGFFEQSGGYGYRINPYNDTTANGLTRCIEDFINHLPGGIGEATRTNTTGTPQVDRQTGKLTWRKGNTRKGVADIRGTYAGRALNIEVKIGRDRQSDAQKAEQERIIRAGGYYWVASSFPEFLVYWEGVGFPLPAFEPVGK